MIFLNDVLPALPWTNIIKYAPLNYFSPKFKIGTSVPLTHT